jgi:hypothetical protein
MCTQFVVAAPRTYLHNRVVYAEIFVRRAQIAIYFYKEKKQEQRMSPKNENGSSAQDARRTMREMLRIYVSFPRHILSVHVKKLSEQLYRAL